MEFTIFSNYVSPARKMRWWWLDIDGSHSAGLQNHALIKSRDEWFSENEANDVEAITVFAGIQGKRDFSVFSRLKNLSGFRNLKFLSIPYDVAPTVNFASISERLEHLHLTPACSLAHHSYWEKGTAPLMPDEVFSRLRALQLSFSPIFFQSFDSERYPNLEWLKIDLSDFDKVARCLKLFEKNKLLKGCSLDTIKNKDLLKKINQDFVGLDLWSITAKDFDFSRIAHMGNLRWLRLRGSQTPIDCEVFAQLENLEELELTRFKQIRNANLLTQLKSLKKLHVLSDTESDIDAKIQAQIQEALGNQTQIKFGA